MDKQFKNIEDFGSRLRGLGGRVSYPDAYKSKYIDLEEFFLDATLFIFEGSRLAIAIENWIYTFGFLISPAKVKNLIKNRYEFDPAVLGVFCEIISKTDKKQININCLKPYIKKNPNLIYRTKSKIEVKISNPDPIWKEFNILCPTFKLDTKKNLFQFDFILNNSPEIKNRTLGIDIVSSDYQAFLSKEGNNLSLNKVSKLINAHYSNLHKVSTRLSYFGLTY